MTTRNNDLTDFVRRCPTAYHTVEAASEMLSKAGYTPLSEAEKWDLRPGQGYYVVRGGSSLIAFKLPAEAPVGWMIAAAHTDSPAFKIKENATLADPLYVRLSTEKYGGMLCASWMDRPLSIAGRVTLRTDEGLRVIPVDLREPCALIPHVAIHMDRKANENASYNTAVDIIPLSGLTGEELRRRVAEAAGTTPERVISTDLFLYVAEEGVTWGDYLS
ncbi:MAG: M18 family aminopeptidase, partial [Clostridia bacterium]|nr:M18 family aminopeptidase [Clostridia bacterium]